MKLQEQFVYILIFLMVLFVIMPIISVGCLIYKQIQYVEELENLPVINDSAILIGYKVSKHSHIYVKTIKNNKTIDIGGLGGRRKPTINLGDTISVAYKMYRGTPILQDFIPPVKYTSESSHTEWIKTP